MSHHAPKPGPPPSWRETSRSTVHTIALKLEGQPPMRVEPATMAANAAGCATQFTPERMRLAIVRSDLGTSLAAAQITGEHVARRDSLGQLSRTMPVDLGSPSWPSWASDIAIKIIREINGELVVGGTGQEDAGTADARRELEKLVEEEERRQAGG